jgi:hypothetical protein
LLWPHLSRDWKREFIPPSRIGLPAAASFTRDGKWSVGLLIFTYPTGASDIGSSSRTAYAFAIYDHVPALLYREVGSDADRRLPVLLRVHRLRRKAQAEAGRLLRVLLVRLGALSADAGPVTRGHLLFTVAEMWCERLLLAQASRGARRFISASDRKREEGLPFGEEEIFGPCVVRLTDMARRQWSGASSNDVPSGRHPWSESKQRRPARSP